MRIHFKILFFLILASGLTAQWDKKFNFGGGEIIFVENDELDRLVIYNTYGNKSTYNGNKLEKANFSEVAINKIKKIQDQKWGLSDNKIFEIEGADFKEYSKFPNEIIDFQNHDHKWYFLTHGNVLLLNNFELSPINAYDENPKENFIAIEELKENIYLLKEMSISLFKDDRIKAIDTFSSQIVDYQKVGDLLYIATDSEIYLFDGQRSKKFVLDSPDGTIKIKGLYFINKVVWYQTENHLVSIKTFQKIRLNDNVRSPIFHSDKWGNLWQIRNGIAYVIPNKSDYKPTLYLKSVLVDGQSIDFNSPIVIKNENGSLEFDLEAIHLLSGESVTYSYYIEPMEKDWSKDSNDQRVKYSNLKAGKYQFYCRAKVNGSEYTYLDPISINVAGSSDNKYLMYIIGLLLGLLGLALYVQNKANKQKQLLELSRKALQAENKLLKEREKVLQLQMNPHFLSNALNSINGMIALEEKSKARKYLKIFSHLMRQVLEQNANEKISISEEVKYLENYLSLEKMMCNEGFEYEINVDEAIDKDKMQIKPMLIQPFLENAIIHGVKKGKLANGKISLNINKVGKGFDINIEDNGEGLKIKSSESHNSMAMEIVRQRLGNKDGLHVVDKREEGRNGVKVNLKLN